MRNHVLAVASLVGLASFLAACGGGGTGGQAGGFEPIEPDKILFWDRQTTETADLLREMIVEFNQDRQPPLVEAQYSGGYSQIFQKVSTAIQARAVPDMAVSYQSMTSEYIRSGAVADMGPLIADPDIGLTEDELADFFPVVVEANHYPEFGNKMYSFPFCKSVLMMYYNTRVLSAAGIDAPPKTWDQFLEQSRQIKAKTGHAAYAVAVDASTIDGMIFSMGGRLLDGQATRFDAPEALRVFRLLETMTKEELAFQVSRTNQEDKAAFAEDEAAFVFRSSSHRTDLVQRMGGTEGWGMSRIPQADPGQPRTVLYGPNICIFETTPERQRIAWEFIRFFTSPDNVVRWALGSGYVPIRKSAAEHPDMKAFWAEWEHNRAAFDCLDFAQSEPQIAGWQEVRDLIETAVEQILSGMKTADEAAADLKKDADAVLARQ